MVTGGWWPVLVAGGHCIFSCKSSFVLLNHIMYDISTVWSSLENVIDPNSNKIRWIFIKFFQIKELVVRIEAVLNLARSSAFSSFPSTIQNLMLKTVHAN